MIGTGSRTSLTAPRSGAAPPAACARGRARAGRPQGLCCLPGGCGSPAARCHCSAGWEAGGAHFWAAGRGQSLLPTARNSQAHSSQCSTRSCMLRCTALARSAHRSPLRCWLRGAATHSLLAASNRQTHLHSHQHWLTLPGHTPQPRALQGVELQWLSKLCAQALEQLRARARAPVLACVPDA